MGRDALLLTRLEAGSDLALLALRLLTGAFLARVMWPNISDPAAMREVIAFFGDAGFIYPELFGPFSAWAQFLIGILLLIGLATRAAGVALAINFLVGLIMVHHSDSFREIWPALSLMVTGLLLAGFGGGRFALDRMLPLALLALDPLDRTRPTMLLAVRIATGAFLIHGVWDNIVSTERMQEFVGFLAAHDFPLPHLMAPLSVYAQLLCGIALIIGLATRWAGLVLAFNFIVAVAMVHLGESFRGIWPAAVLVVFGFIFATIGAGRASIDALLERRS